jgi:hypothetical protein
MRFLGMGVLAGVLLWCAHYFSRCAAEGRPLVPLEELVQRPAAVWYPLALVGHLVLLAALTAEVHDLFAQHSASWIASSAISVVNGPAFAHVALWALYGCALITWDLRRREVYFLIPGFLLIILAIAYGFGGHIVCDYQHVQRLGLNARFIGMGVLVAVMLWSAEYLRKRGAGPELMPPLRRPSTSSRSMP